MSLRVIAGMHLEKSRINVFYVIGKGDKLARIPVNDTLLRAVIEYRAHLKKAPYPAADESKPLIASFITGAAITPRR